MGKIEQAVKHGGLFAMAMPRGSGKALSLKTPLPTPFGWTTMGRVQVGDLLFDEEGWPCQVLHATEVQYGRPCYRVRFSDGESIVCDANHLWSVEDRWSRKNPIIVPTHEMAGRIDLPSQRSQVERRYRIPLAKPLRGPEVDLPVHPYVLGYWLGDGSVGKNAVTVHKDDLEHLCHQLRKCNENFAVHQVSESVTSVTIGLGHAGTQQKENRVKQALESLACGIPPRQAADWTGLTNKTVSAIAFLDRWARVRRGERSSLKVRLEELGVLYEKKFPEVYLRAAPWQRLALLQGLMDTDGSVKGTRGNCEITLKDGPLSHGLWELLSGLGFKWNYATKWVKRDGRTYGPYLRYQFTAYADFPVFRMPRKRERLPKRPASGGMPNYRQIVSIDPSKVSLFAASKSIRPRSCFCVVGP